MKKQFLALGLIWLSTQFAQATEIKDVELFGYARAGVGTSTTGGDQQCFYNQGAGGWGGIGRNEFRLGNECTNYLEVGTKINHIKGENKYAFTQFRLANSHNGSDQTESSSQSTNFVELFAEAYGLNDLPMSFWVGKRFYRDQDVYMDDYYYFGNMNGNGAGFGRLKTLGGELSMAYLRKVSDDTSDVKTDKGKPAITVYDVRLKNVELTDKLKEHFWVAFGSAPGGVETVSHTVYAATSGFVVGTLFDYNLGEGFNHFAIMYGHGLMNGFNMYGDSTVEQGTEADTQNNKNRIRLVNHTTYKLNAKWQGHLSLSHEQVYNKWKNSEEWSSLGVRPIYLVTDNFHLVTEVGTSTVTSDGATRRLTRITFAPELGINADIWGRPVLRAFYSQSFWNDANKAKIAENAPSYADKNSGGAYGFQMETFF